MLELLARIAAELERASIPYMVIGGQAVLIYGEPRFTKDIDITLGCGPERFAEVSEAARRTGLSLLPESPETFVRQTMVLPCGDPATGMRVDLVFSFTPYEQAALERVNHIDVKGVQVAFTSVEDLIIHKMIAGRPRDLDDVRSVVLKNPNADWDHVVRWLRDFETALDQPFVERFEAIRSECDRDAS